MHSFVVRIALRQHVPLRTCVENPQYRFQHMTGGDRLASRTPIGNMLLRKMVPNAFPLFIRQPNHSSFIAHRHQPGILRMGWTGRAPALSGRASKHEEHAAMLQKTVRHHYSAGRRQCRSTGTMMVEADPMPICCGFKMKSAPRKEQEFVAFVMIHLHRPAISIAD